MLPSKSTASKTDSLLQRLTMQASPGSPILNCGGGDMSNRRGLVSEQRDGKKSPMSNLFSTSKSPSDDGMDDTRDMRHEYTHWTDFAAKVDDDIRQLYGELGMTNDLGYDSHRTRITQVENAIRDLRAQVEMRRFGGVGGGTSGRELQGILKRQQQQDTMLRGLSSTVAALDRRPSVFDEVDVLLKDVQKQIDHYRGQEESNSSQFRQRIVQLQMQLDDLQQKHVLMLSTLNQNVSACLAQTVDKANKEQQEAAHRQASLKSYEDSFAAFKAETLARLDALQNDVNSISWQMGSTFQMINYRLTQLEQTRSNDTNTHIPVLALQLQHPFPLAIPPNIIKHPQQMACTAANSKENTSTSSNTNSSGSGSTGSHASDPLQAPPHLHLEPLALHAEAIDSPSAKKQHTVWVPLRQADGGEQTHMEKGNTQEDIVPKPLPVVRGSVFEMLMPWVEGKLRTKNFCCVQEYKGSVCGFAYDNMLANMSFVPHPKAHNLIVFTNPHSDTPEVAILFQTWPNALDKKNKPQPPGEGTIRFLSPSAGQPPRLALADISESNTLTDRRVVGDALIMAPAAGAGKGRWCMQIRGVLRAGQGRDADMRAYSVFEGTKQGEGRGWPPRRAADVLVFRVMEAVPKAVDT
ncbi:unnamed protein product [Vitrella brassicaformis CCMP3155]|uniref:Uncharacterized protein n=2 Tax=Vitrella brassicaformis TaxID=1169539 RepID=A0A0G4F2A4_VITBC|nr:unnamed protein product [Vitrella brassicaformis CCMP3155]|eukprot:CEM06243.1 unnamed protein product [Vitrella brassicaformis CCMP3155]